jgi:hypothetical protein
MIQKTSPWQIALLHPLNLSMIALAFAAGLCAAWWLLPIGLLIWFMMVIFYQNNRDLQLSLVIHSRQGLARRLQDRFARIERSQISFYNSLSSSPRRTRKRMQSLQDAMNSAVDWIHGFCFRLTALENYRAVQKVRNSQAEIEVLNDNIAKALDPRVKAEYEETRQALERRLENLEHINAYMDRVDAQLNNVGLVFEDILSQAISIQATYTSESASDLQRLTQSIQDQVSQLANTEREGSELQALNR